VLAINTHQQTAKEYIFLPFIILIPWANIQLRTICCLFRWDVRRQSKRFQIYTTSSSAVLNGHKLKNASNVFLTVKTSTFNLASKTNNPFKTCFWAVCRFTTAEIILWRCLSIPRCEVRPDTVRWVSDGGLPIISPSAVYSSNWQWLKYTIVSRAVWNTVYHFKLVHVSIQCVGERSAHFHKILDWLLLM
jgi:hypothetical protein